MRNATVEFSDGICLDVESLERILKELTVKLEDSCDFEDILNEAILSLYRVQPEGQENYGRGNSRIGWILLSRSNNRGGPGNTDIEYVPSAAVSGVYNYLQKIIGSVNLRARTYSTIWHDAKAYGGTLLPQPHDIPEVLVKDTEKVMECLGLTLENRGKK